MQLVTPVLSIVKVSENQEDKDKMFLFKERPEVAKFFLDFSLDILLLPYRYVYDNYVSMIIIV